MDPHGPVPAGGELLPIDVQVLVGGHVIGDGAVAVAQQNGRPDDGVKGDVVLPHEVIALRPVSPEFPPLVRRAPSLGPLDARRKVADYRFEPHVDPLVVVVGQGNRDSPVDVPRDGPVLQPVLEHLQGEVEDVGSPVVLLFNPFDKLLLERAEPEEVVLRPPNLGRRSAHPTLQVNKVGGVQGLAAGVALVAPGPGAIAVRTRPLDIAVGEVAAAALAVGQHHLALVDIVLRQQLQEDVLHHLPVVHRPRGCEQVEGDAHPVPAVEKEGLVTVDDYLRGNVLLLGPEGDRRPMLVAPRHHQHLVPLGAMVPGEDVGGKVGAGQVAQVQRAVGVGPSD